MTDSQRHNELKDRLIHQGLHELLGSETPPNLMEKILKAESENIMPHLEMEPTPRIATRSRWIARLIATAALLMVSALIGKSYLDSHSPQVAEKTHLQEQWEDTYAHLTNDVHARHQSDIGTKGEEEERRNTTPEIQVEKQKKKTAVSSGPIASPSNDSSANHRGSNAPQSGLENLNSENLDEINALNSHHQSDSMITESENRVDRLDVSSGLLADDSELSMPASERGAVALTDKVASSSGPGADRFRDHPFGNDASGPRQLGQVTTEGLGTTREFRSGNSKGKSESIVQEGRESPGRQSDSAPIRGKHLAGGRYGGGGGRGYGGEGYGGGGGGRYLKGNFGLESKLSASRFEHMYESRRGDQYAQIHENAFQETIGEDAVSTFSIDVDTASYANVRQFLMQSHVLPPADAVRIEELINYFKYDYVGPKDEHPFAAHVESATCPWNPKHHLVRVALKGRNPEEGKPRPLSNLVFLVDVSGSMNNPNKLPLVIHGLKRLTEELGENDRVAIVVYASSEGLALPSTSGEKQEAINQALARLRAGGSTAGGAGIKLAYKVAQENFIQGGVNRVILCTDGDFNVGTTSTAELEALAERKANETGVFLTALGFGRGNLNDAMMESITNKGNGNYHYVDSYREAQKVLVEEVSGTLVTIAKDVKIQIEFNPAHVAGYRLIGYENRMLAREDFNDDAKDAGEIGAGHTVTALYEIVPAGTPVRAPKPEPLKYQRATESAEQAADDSVPLDDETDQPRDLVASDEMLTIRLRYKQPENDTSTKIEFPVKQSDQRFADSSRDFQLAAATASFGMMLRNSEHKGNASWENVLELATGAIGNDADGYRLEFIEMIKQAQRLANP